MEEDKGWKQVVLRVDRSWSVMRDVSVILQEGTTDLQTTQALRAAFDLSADEFREALDDRKAYKTEHSPERY